MSFMNFHNPIQLQNVIKYISLISLFLLLIYPARAINNQELTENSFELNQVSLSEFNASKFIDDMIVSLEENAVYDNEVLLGWIRPYFDGSNPDPYIFNGYQTGIAGIGDFLLDAYLIGHSNALPLLLTITNRLIQNYTIDPTGGIYWVKYANFDSDGWLGDRYGNVGIARFLARAQFEGVISDVDEIVEQSYLWVKNHQLDDGRWPYDEYDESQTTTGLEYGAAGIAYSFTQSYRYLGNNSYLDDAISIADWILQKGTYEGDIFYIPWSLIEDGSEFEGERYTGIGVGSAGIIQLMIEMYDLTTDINYYDAIVGLANDLLARDLGGFWPLGSLRYITNLLGHTALIGYLTGASGIADILNQVYDLTKDSRYLESSIRSEKWMESLITENGTVGMGLQREDRFFTGLTLGSSGVAKFFINQYENYHVLRQADHATSILNHLHETLLQYGMMPIEENELRNGFSWTIDNGLAGIGKVVVDYIKSNIGNSSTTNTPDEEYLRLYSNVTASSQISNPDESSDSDKGNSLLFFSFSSFLIIIVIAVRQVKK